MMIQQDASQQQGHENQDHEMGHEHEEAVRSRS
jgi:hypothetical protein